MRDTMEHCKDSINWKLLRSMGNNRFRYGGEAMIFLLLSWKLMTQDILKMIKDIKVLLHKICPKLKY